MSSGQQHKVAKLSRRLMVSAAKNEKTIRIAAAVIGSSAGLLFGYCLYAIGQVDSTLAKLTSLEQAQMEPVKVHFVGLIVFSGILHLAGQVLLIWLPRAEAEASEALIEMGEHLSRSDEAIARHIQIISSTEQSIATLDGIISRNQPATSSKEISDDCSELLAPFVAPREARQRIFFFDDAAFYSAALYLFDKEQRLLKAVWRHCHDEFKKANKGLGRDWEPKVGHVGQCYDQGEIIVASDLQASYQLPPEDCRLYGSAVSIPILYAQEVVGVCIITSSAKGQFGKRDDSKRWLDLRMPAETIGHILSVYISYVISFGNGMPGERNGNQITENTAVVQHEGAS